MGIKYAQYIRSVNISRTIARCSFRNEENVDTIMDRRTPMVILRVNYVRGESTGIGEETERR